MSFKILIADDITAVRMDCCWSGFLFTRSTAGTKDFPREERCSFSGQAAKFCLACLSLIAWPFMNVCGHVATFKRGETGEASTPRLSHHLGQAFGALLPCIDRWCRM